jgi:transposase-like protein
VWLCFRFALSLRDVEDLPAQRGIEVGYGTIRCWTIKFGRQIARNLKRRRPAPSQRWHQDNRAENAHLPIRRRERRMQGFKSQASAQRFLTTHAVICNTFHAQSHLIHRQVLRQFRGEAVRVWSEAVA